MTSATDTMQVTAIAPWFGGKRTLAPLIVEELGPHTAYWEPFCGSMAVLFAKGVVIYIDSPYFRESRGDGGGSDYEHDFTPADHTRLAAAVARFERARVVVSYYDDPRLVDLYPPDRWTHRSIETQKNLHVQNRRGVGRCTVTEVLIINGPSFMETGSLFQ